MESPRVPAHTSLSRDCHPINEQNIHLDRDTIPQGSRTLTLMPQCRVCGREASGVHYGVSSCQSCRMFFRRMLTKNFTILCMAEGMCDVSDQKRRLTCTACRFNRCKELGMKKGDMNTARKKYKQETNNCSKEAQSLEWRTWGYKTDGRSNSRLTEIKRNKELEDIAAHLHAVHRKQKQNHSDVLQALCLREVRHKEKASLEAMLFGPMTSISKDEYDTIYQSTGVDIDGRKKCVRKLIPSFEKSAICFIKFAKEIPGFVKLPASDQINLLRASATMADVVSTYHIYNRDLHAWLDIDCPGNSMSVDELAMIHDKDSCQTLEQTIVTLQQLDLTPEEHTVLYAYLIVTTGATVSREGCGILYAMIDTMEEVLYMEMKKHHEDTDSFLCKVMSAVLKVISTMETWGKQYYNVMASHPELPWPEVLKNIFMPQCL